MNIVDNNWSRQVCVCNESISCDDELKFEWPTKSKQTKIIRSSEQGERFHYVDISDYANYYQVYDHNEVKSATLRVSTSKRRQTIMGWGGAFTDAAGYHFSQLSPVLLDKILNSLFGSSGLEYNVGRVTIAGSDFSSRPYTYDDKLNNEPDLELKNWSLTKEDLEYKIPFILKALELTHGNLKLFASPWSPPTWMKDNGNIIRGHLLDSDDIYDAYARYLIKFFDAYEEKGIKFWGATIQNEPIASYNPLYFFNSLQMSADEAIRFVSKFYGPALEASNRTKSNFKLMVGDDSLGLINLQVGRVMADPSTAKYISGLAFHWYSDGIVPYSVLDSLYESIKDKIDFVFMTEACNGDIPTDRGVKLGDWNRGEKYALDILNDLNHNTNAWIDWNMALDMSGGPNWANNFVDSPIIVDAKKGEYYKQPMYYALAHFSKLFKAGSQVIDIQLNSNHGGLTAIGVIDTYSGHLAINIINQYDEVAEVKIQIDDQYEIPPIIVERKSITSVLTKL